MQCGEAAVVTGGCDREARIDRCHDRRYKCRRMYAAVAEMIVVITRLILIVALAVTGAVNLMAVLVRVNRRGAGGFRNTLETG